ncbi:MAG: ABC transporter permease [Chloroflexota bacterium]|jgi:ABC-type dipeptide/oligopeptide/nickel transport system permease component
MTQFILRRVLLSVPVLIGIVFLTFALARVIPGDPCKAALGEKATEAVCAPFRERYGLNKPITTQFAIYLNDLSHGDLGKSIRQNRPVATLLVERLPLTVELTLYALAFATILGILLGRLSAVRRNSPVDVGTMVFANFGVSIPVFVLGLLLAYFFAVVLKGTPFSLPASGRLSSGVTVHSLVEVWGLEDWTGLPRAILDFLSGIYTFTALITGQWAALADAVRHMILPMIALGTIPMAIIARMTRSSLLDVLGQDYIRTARAKGLRERFVVSRHGMRNALLPVVTVIGLSLGGLLSGAVLTESVFNLTGIGRTITEAITGRDYIVVQGIGILVAVLYVFINLIVDVSYAMLDPRIRLS